jgi:segregation and condensation protein B
MSDLEVKELKNSIECLLFASAEPLSLKKIARMLDVDTQVVRGIIEQLQEEYSNRGIMILEIAQGFRMCTSPKYGELLKKLYSNPSNDDNLSLAMLETLAIIAYNQPITKAEIEYIRGVNSSAQLQKLLKKRLIKVIGRKDIPGRPFLYGTTKEFLRCFGLPNISSLPPIDMNNKEVELVA